MKIFRVVRKSDNKVLYEYQSDAAVPWVGMEFAACDHIDITPSTPVEFAAPVYGGRRILTKLEFRSLFPAGSLMAIDRLEAQFETMDSLSAEQKDAIRTAFSNYHEAQDIDLDNDLLTAGLPMYVALGFLTADQLAEVLRG